MLSKQKFFRLCVFDAVDDIGILDSSDRISRICTALGELASGFWPSRENLLINIGGPAARRTPNAIWRAAPRGDGFGDSRQQTQKNLEDRNLGNTVLRNLFSQVDEGDCTESNMYMYS